MNSTRKSKPIKKAEITSKDAVVKIDSDLLKKIEQFLQLPQNKYKYSSKKQIMDLAILEFLNSHSLSQDKEQKERGRSYV